jgi:2'-5' RNA ligase
MEAAVAVDVAILPPPIVSEAAIRLSAALPASESKGLQLDAKHLPHITLTQQFVRATEVGRVAEAIARVLCDREPLPLVVTGPGRGSSSVWMQVGVTPALLDLHRDLMDALEPFERSGANSSAFVGGSARAGDVKWVSRFRQDSSYSRYQPHVTLGHATKLPHITPLAFNADTVALFHLGRFCSCGDVLESWRLPVL